MTVAWSKTLASRRVSDCRFLRRSLFGAGIARGTTLASLDDSFAKGDAKSWRPKTSLADLGRPDDRFGAGGRSRWPEPDSTAGPGPRAPESYRRSPWIEAACRCAGCRARPFGARGCGGARAGLAGWRRGWTRRLRLAFETFRRLAQSGRFALRRSTSSESCAASLRAFPSRAAR